MKGNFGFLKFLIIICIAVQMVFKALISSAVFSPFAFLPYLD